MVEISTHIYLSEDNENILDSTSRRANPEWWPVRPMPGVGSEAKGEGGPPAHHDTEPADVDVENKV